MSKTLKLVALLLVIVISAVPNPSTANAQEGLHCPDFEPVFQELETLPGVIIYSGGESDSLVAALDGVTLETYPIPSARALPYAFSPNGLWFLTTQHDEQEQTTYWIHHVDGEQNLRVIRFNQDWSFRLLWFDDNTLLIRHRGLPPYYASIAPFSETPSVEAWLNFGDWVFLDHVPQTNLILLLNRSEDGHGLYSIYDISTGTISPLSDTNRFHNVPIWSPDGSQMVYALGTEFDEETRIFNKELFLANSRGQDAVQLTDFAGQFGTIQIWRMIWSPDGSQLALTIDFVIEDYTSDYHESVLYVFDIDTREIVSFCVEPYSSGTGVSWAWSPDSQYIAFVYSEQLVVVEVSTGLWTILDENVWSVHAWSDFVREQ